MHIHFSPDRWQNIKTTYGKWWAGELERPIMPVISTENESNCKKPQHLWENQKTFADLSISPKALIESYDYELSKMRFVGDAYPYFNMACSGPGIIAAFLGADVDASTGRIWFHPKDILPIQELHFEYDAENIWFKRIKDICCEGLEKWQGQVLISMPDIGGAMDILSTFRPAEHLLLDLFDEPDEVKRLIWELHQLWFRYFNEINEILYPLNPGYSDWSSVYSCKPSYILQSDFSYMIGPDMFEEFVLPELAASAKKLPASIYHLDGVGQLAHLDLLLQIHELGAVQWVPGDGKPPQKEWPHVYQKIHSSGKNILMEWQGFETVKAIADSIGTYKGINQIVTFMSKEALEEIQKGMNSQNL